MVFAPHYALAHPCLCIAPSAFLRATPAEDRPAVSQLVHGERFAVLDLNGAWAWGYGLHDRYVGYLPKACLGPVGAPPTHRIAAIAAPLFAAADIKARVVATWPIGAAFAGTVAGGFVDTGRGFVHLRHAAAIDEVADPVMVAERLTGVPYRWGGRSGDGIDCSGLVQLALAFAGIPCPRDSDQQRMLGSDLPAGEALRRGDMIFFPGHVGLMADGERLLHANAHWMATVVEPLADVVARLRASGHGQPILARRRIG